MPTDTLNHCTATSGSAISTIHHVVVDGPTDDQVQLAVKQNAGSVKDYLPLRFVTGSAVNLLSLCVTEAQPENGSGTPLTISGTVLGTGEHFTGHYNASTRSGYIDVSTS